MFSSLVQSSRFVSPISVAFESQELFVVKSRSLADQHIFSFMGVHGDEINQHNCKTGPGKKKTTDVSITPMKTSSV